MARLKEQYQSEMVDALIKKFGYKNIMEVPKLDKIVINMGVGEAKENAKVLDGAVKDMAKLCHAYAEATTIKLAVVTGKAYGPAFIALAGKGSNADLSFALDTAVISALAPVTAVEFLQHDELKGAADLTAARNTLADKFAKENASAAVAAKNGCVDGIIAKNEIRQTLMDSIEVMAGKRISRLPKKHSNIQL